MSHTSQTYHPLAISMAMATTSYDVMQIVTMNYPPPVAVAISMNLEMLSEKAAVIKDRDSSIMFLNEFVEYINDLQKQNVLTETKGNYFIEQMRKICENINAV